MRTRSRVPRQRSVAASPVTVVEVRRPGIIYGIDTWRIDPVTWQVTRQVEVGYVGQTRQALEAREGQHLVAQPFSDVIVGRAYIIAQGMYTDAELDAAEKLHILTRLPRYNIEHNMGNPHRIPPWTAVAQRQAREPGWTPPVKGGWIPRQRGVQVVAVDPPSALARWWVRRRWWVYGLAALWLALFAGVCWLAAPRLDDGDTATVAAAGATAPFVLTWAEVMRRRVRAWWRRTTRPKRRSRRRR